MLGKEKKESEKKKLEKIDDYSSRLEVLMNKTRSLGLLTKEHETRINDAIGELDIIRERVLSESKCNLNYVKRPTESSFNEMLYAVNQIDQSLDLNGFYPTVEMLNDFKIDKNVPKYIHMIMFFSTDPYTKFDKPEKDEEEYQEMVKYCKELIQNIELRN